MRLHKTLDAPPSLDDRYLEFRDNTCPVFVEFPQLAPLRQAIFRDCVANPQPVRFADTVKHWLRPWFRTGQSAAPLAEAEIVIWIEGTRPIIWDTLSPVWQELHRRAVRVRPLCYSAPPSLPPGTVTFDYAARARAPQWAASAWDALCEAERTIDRTRRKRWFLQHCANLASLLSEMGRVLDELKPRVVVAASSQMLGGHSLFTAAQERGIRTILLQHGVIQPFYTPLAADVMVTWGSSSNETLLALGVESDRMVALGSPRHDAMGRLPQAAARQALRDQLHLEDKLILLFFSNGNDLLRNGTAPQHCARWLNQIAEQFKGTVHVVVRLHPNEDGRLYANYPQLIVTRAEVPFETAMAGCDCVSSLCSTAMYEALLYGKPVWQLHAEGWPILADNWSQGFAARIASDVDLAAAVARLLHREGPAPSATRPVEEAFANHGRAAGAVAEYLLSGDLPRERERLMPEAASVAGHL